MLQLNCVAIQGQVGQEQGKEGLCRALMRWSRVRVRRADLHLRWKLYQYPSTSPIFYSDVSPTVCRPPCLAPVTPRPDPYVHMEMSDSWYMQTIHDCLGFYHSRMCKWCMAPCLGAYNFGVY